MPRALWSRLFKLRNRYHSLEDTLEVQGLQGYEVPPIEQESVETLAPVGASDCPVCRWGHPGQLTYSPSLGRRHSWASLRREPFIGAASR